ncbi:MAG: T9SS type A sorting domain-containing protein [Candidatus Marinimicrobia bacterium]|nr:T9SS type A sorting domain-containing protein [Candidatus Neomarinimicrobiota bacterium]
MLLLRAILTYLLFHISLISQQPMMSNNQINNYSSQLMDGAYIIDSYKDMSNRDNWRLISATIELWLDTSWINNFNNSYNYDESNNIAESINRIWISDEWQNYRRNIYTYNGNNIFESVIQEWSENNWINFNRNMCYYDVNNNKTQVTFQHWTEDDWEDFYQSNNYYGDDNNLIEVIYRNWTIDIWENSSRRQYIYDQNRNLIEDLHQTWSDSLWENNNIHNYSYDIENNLIEDLSQIWVDTFWVNSSLYQYNYDQNLVLTEKVEHIWVDNNWNNNQRNLYYYENDTTEFRIQIWNTDSWLNSSQYLSIYDINNNRIESLHKEWSGIEWENYSRNQYSYEEFLAIYSNATNNIPDEFTLLSTFPNPFNPIITIQYTITKSELISIKVYDLSGSEISILVNKNKLAGEHEVKWDAIDQPSGVYFILAEFDNIKNHKKILLIK